MRPMCTRLAVYNFYNKFYVYIYFLKKLVGISRIFNTIVFSILFCSPF